jgi:hypothetical protein
VRTALLFAENMKENILEIYLDVDGRPAVKPISRK